MVLLPIYFRTSTKLGLLDHLLIVAIFRAVVGNHLYYQSGKRCDLDPGKRGSFRGFAAGGGKLSTINGHQLLSFWKDACVMFSRYDASPCSVVSLSYRSLRIRHTRSFVYLWCAKCVALLCLDGSQQVL